MKELGRLKNGFGEKQAEEEEEIIINNKKQWNL